MGESVVISQRAIYDARYEGDGYDARSQVRVLTAERDALNRAARRAVLANPTKDILSLVDFGYGTGRVTNEFVTEFLRDHSWAPDRGLRVIAYDVSSTGLRKAAAGLANTSFEANTDLTWRPEALHGYVAGSLVYTRHDPTVGAQNAGEVTVVFVHGSEHDSPAAMARLLREANDGEQSLITSSWYSGLGHVNRPGDREAFFRELGDLTHPDGEMIIAVASLGDVVSLQREWEQRMRDGDTRGFPVEVAGDVVYETELGQSNFFHVFGEDLNHHMEQITGPGQAWWIEGIRFPDDEFENEAQEHSNYEQVAKMNKEKARTHWTTDDFRRLHTVAGFRSPRSGPSAGIA